VNQEDLHQLILALSNQDANIEDLLRRLEDLERREPDLLVVPWTDYGGSSTVVGWSSFTTKTILYKKSDNTVFVQFALQGPSSLTTASFTLPDSTDALGSGQSFQVLVYGIDNGSPQTLPARLDIPASGNVFNVYKTLAVAGWSPTGTKGVRGEFQYEAA